ncbi:hypothetical protein AAFC00_001929 [Neodothiora populina]|uniref:Hydantoinase B/oxoprolinase domain-containing protein n=1 Tax=Neodothiora populina TaxID=2781224 RepID=A0ABR3PQL1_9PEZI
MPPNSTELWQEGAAIHSHLMIRDNKFDEEGLTKIFAEPGLRPDCSGSRRLSDNFSDLKAQAAANNKGAILLHRLIEEHSLEKVHLYMNAIQTTAELAVRNFLIKCQEQRGSFFQTTETMDNSSTISLAITIRDDGSATFDFTGTTPELYSNMNAPTSITYSGIIYCLRSMIGSDIPLNQGCLAPIEIILPKGCFLNPSPHAAVCAGNTQTSQRVVDTILKAFEFCAASQGCMNCLGFFGGGNALPSGQDTGFAYAIGETICGGAGAGPSWQGASGVHTHMTNTRITDAEVLEKRYPVLLREFSIRKGSGGKGLFDGGDGVIRDYECRAPLHFSVITGSRTRRPYGMAGGEQGENGANYWVRKLPDGGERWINIGQKSMVGMQTEDRCVIYTPSGGGWGTPVGDAIVNGWKPVVQYPRAMGSVDSGSE